MVSSVHWHQLLGKRSLKNMFVLCFNLNVLRLWFHLNVKENGVRHVSETSELNTSDFVKSAISAFSTIGIIDKHKYKQCIIEGLFGERYCNVFIIFHTAVVVTYC